MFADHRAAVPRRRTAANASPLAAGGTVVEDVSAEGFDSPRGRGVRAGH